MSKPTLIQKVKDQAMRYRGSMGTFSVLVIVNILAAAVGWLTQIKLANSLGKDLFGQVTFGVVLGGFGQVFIRFGLDRTLVRDLIHYPDQFGKLVRGSLIVRCALTLMIFTCLIIWMLLIKTDSLSWDIILITMSWSFLSLDLQPAYDASNRIKRHTYFFLIQKVCYLLFIWNIILFFPEILTVRWIGVTLFSSVILFLLLQYRWETIRQRIGGFTLREDIRSALWLIRENWLIWVSSMAGVMTGMLNQVILKHQFGYSELGGYAAAWQFVTAGTLFIDQMSRIGRPAMARYTLPEVPKADLVGFLVKYLAVMTVTVFPLAFAMFCFPKFIISLFFKSGYLSAQRELPILGIYLLTSAVGYIFSQYIISVRLDKLYFYSTIFGGLSSIILCSTIISPYGSVGAAWTILLSSGATFVVIGAGMLKHLLDHPETTHA